MKRIMWYRLKIIYDKSIMVSILRFHVGEIKKGYILKHIKRELKFKLHKNHSKCGVQEDKRGTYHT